MASKTKTKIAVIHPHPNFLAAIKVAFGMLFEGFEFITVKENKLKHVPSDCDQIATFNTYPFPTGRKFKDHVFGLKYIADDKDGSLNRAQKEAFWNPETDPIVIAKMLNTPSEVTIIPGGSVLKAQTAMLEAENKMLKAEQTVDNSGDKFETEQHREIAILQLQIEAMNETLDAVRGASAV
tara:strand:+ start:61 stop:603 length:543 start_codon:yes stop_codon:yes gene_type:complete